MFYFIKCSWLWSADIPFGPNQWSKITLSKEAILLVLTAQSSDEENDCQGKHEQAVQNLVMIHLAWSAAVHNYTTEQQATQNGYAYSSTTRLSLRLIHPLKSPLYIDYMNISSHAYCSVTHVTASQGIYVCRVVYTY